jgi:3-carboxy-cis,cis-muconate cycloisomerase
MASTIIDSRIFQGIFSSDAMRQVWSDENRTQKYLDIERALALVQGRLGLIPQEAADEIVSHCHLDQIDMDRLRQQTERIGYPILGVVSQLNQLCRDKLGEYVPLGRHHPGHHRHRHRAADPRGAGAGRRRPGRDLGRRWPSCPRTPADAGDRPQQPAAGHSRDLRLQDGRPAVGRERHRERLAQLKERVLVGEFAGAAGTLASLETGAMETQAGLCAELGLKQPVIAWHTIRDNIAEVGTVLGLIGGTLGKLSMDVKLMMQTEVGEVYEPYHHGRGSSSTMPQKRNPISSCYIHAAISVVRQHAAALMDAMVADHERSTGPWEIEWIVLPEAFCLMAGALKQSRWCSKAWRWTPRPCGATST